MPRINFMHAFEHRPSCGIVPCCQHHIQQALQGRWVGGAELSCPLQGVPGNAQQAAPCRLCKACLIATAVT